MQSVHPVTPNQYRKTLARLDLAPASKATAEALGVTLRTAQRYVSGETPIPRTVELLLDALLRERSRITSSLPEGVEHLSTPPLC